MERYELAGTELCPQDDEDSYRAARYESDRHDADVASIREERSFGR